MDDDMQRRFIHGILTLVLGLLTAWLATYITNKLLGEPRKA